MRAWQLTEDSNNDLMVTEGHTIEERMSFKVFRKKKSGGSSWNRPSLKSDTIASICFVQMLSEVRALHATTCSEKR